jgi:hypothetical protein
MSLASKYERLLSRRAPQLDRTSLQFSESFETESGIASKYLVGAMQAVARKYTDKLIEQGDRIEEQLKKRLALEYPRLNFRRQGSVSNDTHIRYHSDVDVLVIIDKFETLESGLTPSLPYTGDPNEELKKLRKRCATELDTAFSVASIDDSGSSCVTISGGSLVCSVDAVPANWFNTIAWTSSKNESDRGIQIYNRDTNSRPKNYPFRFNQRIDNFDAVKFGIPRRLIRLLKSIKADHEELYSNVEIDFSSFDICSLIYRMPIQSGATLLLAPLQAVSSLIAWIESILDHESLRRSLMTADDSRLIFDTSAKTQGLRILLQDLSGLLIQAQKEGTSTRMTPSVSLLRSL